MMTAETIGDKLLALKSRSGLSLNQIAKSGGYKNASSIQRYFSGDYAPEFLPSSIARRFEEALVGYGSPAITTHDISELTEFGFLDRRQVPKLPDFTPTERPLIECYAAYATRNKQSEIETFTLGQDVIRAFKKPTHLNYRHVKGVFIESTAMMPRYSPGEVVFYEMFRPATHGADAVIFFNAIGEEAQQVAIGRIESSTRDAVTLEFYSPPMKIAVLRDDVEMICPILAPSDLLEQQGPAAIYA